MYIRSTTTREQSDNPFPNVDRTLYVLMSTPSTEATVDNSQTNWLSTSCAISEREEKKHNPLESSLFSFDVNAGTEDSVYVAVGKSQSSMDALLCTLNHFDFVNGNTSTALYLVHVFPEIRHIPSPLGMLPKSQVSPTLLEYYVEQERGKRRQFLQKFINVCSASKVKVKSMLIESDMVAKAILDLIPVLNISKLVVGTGTTNPSKPRKIIKSRIAFQIFQSAPISCEVKIVSEGKEVISQMMPSLPPSPAPYYQDNSNEIDLQLQDDSISCTCFKPKF